MIKKLRNKMIAISLSSILLVLFLILGSINYLNYRNVVKSADGILAMLSDNGGSFDITDPGRNDDEHPDVQSGIKPDEGRKDLGKDDTGNMKPMIKDRRDMKKSPETPFESRYFYVILDEDGNIVDENTDTVAAIGNDVAEEYAEEAFQSNGRNGFIDDYRYTLVDTEDGTMLIFLDCARSMNNFLAFLRTSVFVAVTAFIIVSLIIIILSRRIVKPVAESYDKQKRFITDAGHEIKTPLTIIEADAAVMEMENGSNEWLDDIKAQTSRLAALTKDLIYLSRMEEVQKDERKFDSFSLSDLATDTAKSFESRALLDGKSYDIDIDDDIQMTGDGEAIDKLLNILLDNAFKYSDDAGSISISLNRIGKQARLSVFNTAEQISADELPQLFDRFYRGDKSRNSESGGYGIGLSIAQAVVTAHDGRIQASTEDGHSLMINVTFPI